MPIHTSQPTTQEIELIKIETTHLSLVIKGKPFHEKYEGLHQYRKLDFNDLMNFAVNGEDIQSVKVFDVDENMIVDESTHRPIFFENGVYQVIVSPKTNESLTFYHEHPALRQAIDKVAIGGSYVLMGNLKFQNEVGFSTFEIRSANKTLLEVTIEVFPSKLDYRNDYKKLLQEVNDEIYNLAFHFIKKTYLSARTRLEGNPSRSEFYRLIKAHFDSLLQAINRIEHQPHHKLITNHVKARGDQLGRQDQKARQYLRKKPNLFQKVDHGIKINGQSVMPMSGLKLKKELTYDTLENRFIKWMMVRLIDKLDDLLAHLKNRHHRFEENPDLDLIEIIENMIKKLNAKTKASFWKNIGVLDRSVMSLVLQMAPGYRDAFQIYLIVSRGLAIEGKLYQMSVKDVAVLYEYWTFLKLGQILDNKYIQVSQDIVKVNRDGLFVNLQSNQTAKRVYKHPYTNEKITLIYQRREGRLPTITQIPDTMLCIEKKGKDYTYNYVFDAKYRVDFAVEGTSYHSIYKQPGPMEDDINTMHRYRDSLVVRHNGPYERNAFGAYVLFPLGNEDDYENHKLYKSIDEVNIGGLPFLPNATRLVEQFVEHLIDKSPEDIQKEGILPRGTKEEWNSSLDEKVLVGMVPCSENYQAHVKHRFYHVPVNRLRKGWQEVEYVALYPKKGAARDNGVVCYGKIIEVNVVIRHDIKELASDSKEEYVRFEVEPWVMLDKVIKPVGYGISVYTMTTLHILKQSEELPELFMKSKEEVKLWRMLRRISERVKFELDDNHLDRASSIISYRLKELVIRPNIEDRVLQIENGHESEKVSMNELQVNPSSVFKRLIELL